MPDFDLSGELSLKIELHMLRPITEKVHSGNGPVSLVAGMIRKHRFPSHGESVSPYEYEQWFGYHQLVFDDIVACFVCSPRSRLLTV